MQSTFPTRDFRLSLLRPLVHFLWKLYTCRSNLPEMFYKKSVLENSQNSQENHRIPPVAASALGGTSVYRLFISSNWLRVFKLNFDIQIIRWHVCAKFFIIIYCTFTTS